MPSRRFLYVIILSFLATALPVSAQQQEIKEYKVQKGDTLWDISKKELNDPFLWPKVWKENPDIGKPDRLTPGQTIKIPLYLIQKELTPAEPVAETAVQILPPVEEVKSVPEKIKPLVDGNLYMASGHFAASVSNVGRITGTPLGKSLIATFDMFYIKTSSPSRLGDRFFIIRPSEPVHHPVTKAPIGRIVEILGIAEVKKYENGDVLAQLIRSFEEVRVGDVLDTYEDKQPPVIGKPFRRPDVSGVIVAARQLRMNNGVSDIVYLDRGRKHGVEDGDVLQIIAAGAHRVPIGIAQVFKVGDSYSVAIVRESKDFITTGNYVVKAQ